MSMFDLKGSDSNNWNYSDNTKANYREWIQGTVVEISNPQARDFNTGQPAFWPDGNPKRNLMMTLLQQDNTEVTWTFSPKSVAANACLAALDPQGTREQVSIEELLGKFVTIQTQAGNYNNRQPRPWAVRVDGDGQANAVRGLKDLSQPQPAPMPGMPAPQPAPVMQQPVMQQPAPVSAPMQQQPAPMQQQPAPAPQQQVNPAIQASMNQAAQALGFQQNAQANAAPVNQVPTQVYDNPAEQYYSDDIPF